MSKYETGSLMCKYTVKCSEDSHDCLGTVDVEIPVPDLRPEEAYAYLMANGEEPVCAGCGSDA